MDPIFMNSENSKTYETCLLIRKLTDKLDLILNEIRQIVYSLYQSKEINNN